MQSSLRSRRDSSYPDAGLGKPQETDSQKKGIAVLLDESESTLPNRVMIITDTIHLLYIYTVYANEADVSSVRLRDWMFR